MDTPHVVYHVAAMGDWREVVREQLWLLRESGLTDVRVTHVGGGLDWLRAEAARQGVSITVVRTDPNTDHYETFAMLEIERLAKADGTDRPVLYLHTKGVAHPGDRARAEWRRLMGEHVVRRWRDNLAHLAGHDAVGVNWQRHGEPHFSGNFWLARPDWVRRLPDFAGYHAAKGFVRFSCETWVGAAPGCRAESLVCSDQPFWAGGYDFHQWRGAGGPAPAAPAGRFDYHGFTAQQSEGVLDAFPAVLADLRPARVLEVGTGHGGLAVLLRHALDDLGLAAAPVLSLDTADRPGHGRVRAEGVDVRVGDFFSPNRVVADPRLAGYVGGPGPTLVLCDGGDKAGEFRALAPALKPGDVIMAHDYAPTLASFCERVAGRAWDWLEFTDADAAGPAAEHGLAPWHPDAMAAVHWLSMRKTGAGSGGPPRSPDVSVCIPTIPPRRRLLLRALESVETQLLRPAETVVRCDHRRLGSAATRNRALGAVRTPWVAFLDDDDEMCPHHLRDLWACARETGADVVYPGAVVLRDGAALPERDEWGRFGKPFDPDLLRRYSYIQTTSLVRTELARAVGGFQFGPDSVYDDWGFFLALLDAGARIVHLPVKTWVWHHWGDGRPGAPGNTSGLPTRW